MLFSKITIQLNRTPFQNQQVIKGLSYYFPQDSALNHIKGYQSVITCISKEGKDKQYIGNWRPISLLNTDIKIASAALANILRPVLPFIISDIQKAFMKDRFMGENTHLLYDLMHYLQVITL
jgi:hypothetical protein